MIKGNDDTRFGRRLESLFWWIVRLFPLLLFCCFVWGFFKNPVYQDIVIGSDFDFFLGVFGYGLELSRFFQDYFAMFSNNVIYQTFLSIFGRSGVLPFGCDWLFWYASYLVLVELTRFFVNFFLFIVRFANNLFEKMCR